MYKVAVLVSIYKSRLFLASKLENLKNQTIFNDCQIILLNCQNLQNESEIYQEFSQYSNVIVTEYTEYRRLYSTWNDGIKASNSQYIMNSNVDDILTNNCIEKLSLVLDNNQGYDIVHCDFYVTPIPNQINSNEWQWYSTMHTQYPNGTAGPCPMWRRSLHAQFGYFDDYRVISDALMWERWYLSGKKFYHYNEYLAIYYQGGNLEARRDNYGELLRDLDLRDHYGVR